MATSLKKIFLGPIKDPNVVMGPPTPIRIFKINPSH